MADARINSPRPTTLLYRVGKKNMTILRYRQQGGKCYYCGRRVRLAARGIPSDNPDLATLEHRVPRSAGGTEDDDNLVCACWSCNSAKDNMTEEKFRELLAIKEKWRNERSRQGD